MARPRIPPRTGRTATRSAEVSSPRQSVDEHPNTDAAVLQPTYHTQRASNHELVVSSTNQEGDNAEEAATDVDAQSDRPLHTTSSLHEAFRSISTGVHFRQNIIREQENQTEQISRGSSSSYEPPEPNACVTVSQVQRVTGAEDTEESIDPADSMQVTLTVSSAANQEEPTVPSIHVTGPATAAASQALNESESSIAARSTGVSCVPPNSTVTPQTHDPKRSEEPLTEERLVHKPSIPDEYKPFLDEGTGVLGAFWWVNQACIEDVWRMGTMFATRRSFCDSSVGEVTNVEGNVLELGRTVRWDCVSAFSPLARLR